MNDTERFSEFHAQRNTARAAAAAEKITWRKAVALPGGDPGYVARLGQTERRAYAKRFDHYRYSFGLIDAGALRIYGHAETLAEAKRAAFDLLKVSPEQSGNGATAADPAVRSERSTMSSKTKTAAVETTPTEIRDGLIAALNAAIENVETVPNKDNRYDRLRVDGKSFALVFAPGARGVPTQIPKQLLNVAKSLPKAANFKTTKWGLTSTLKSADVIDATVEAFVIAAKAAQESKPRQTAKLADSKPEPVEALATKVADPVDTDSPAVTPNSVVLKVDGKKVKPDPKPSAKKQKRTTKAQALIASGLADSPADARAQLEDMGEGK